MLERLRAAREGEIENKTVGWHHRLNGHEFEQTLGASEGQGSLAYCIPCGHKESDMIEQLNNNNGTSNMQRRKFTNIYKI